MAEPRPRVKLWLATALVAAVILYGSLYPFTFRVPIKGDGPLAAFLATIGRPPGRGDAIANILLYIPFGFFFLLGIRRRAHQAAGLVAATIIGGLLSFGIELGQYYDAGRVTTFTDCATNTIGTLLGGLAAMLIGAHIRLPFIGEVTARPVPTLLVLSWLAYRLYPYVPTIDLHKYWDALKPIVLTPSLTGYDLFRQTAIWLTLYALIEAMLGRRRSALLAPLFAVGVLCAKIAIVGTVLRLSEPLGALIAFAIWLPLLWLPIRVQAAIAGLLISSYVIALRLEPFTFLTDPRDFGWIPFRGVMQGALHINALAFLEKFFLYGSMVYLLGTALGHRLLATVLTASVLFATSWAETWLPGRSGEITDALIALIAAAVLALLPGPRSAREAEPAPRLSARERRLRDWQREQARALGVNVDQ